MDPASKFQMLYRCCNPVPCSTCELEDFHSEEFPSEPTPKLHSSAVVAEVLCRSVMFPLPLLTLMSRSVEEIMNRHLVSVPDESLRGELEAKTGQLVAKTGVSSDFKPKGKKRDVVGQDVQVIPPFIVNLLYLQWLMLQLFVRRF